MGVRATARSALLRLGLDVRRVGGSYRSAESIAALCDAAGASPEDQRAAIRLLDGLGQLVGAGTPPLGQLMQHALALGNVKLPGYFVEVGAGHPHTLSNVARLIDPFGWRGIRIDPNPEFAAHHRMSPAPGVAFVEAAVGQDDGGSMELIMAGELSTRTDLMSSDRHGAARRKAMREGKVVHVPVRRLDVLMKELRSPPHIQFLSVDTEGAEVQVLQTFPFEDLTVDVICVEHNFRPGEIQALNDLLVAKGYIRVLSSISAWDAWYVPRSDSA